MQKAYIYDALRTVRGKGNKKGALLTVTPVQLVVQLLEALQNKHTGLNTQLVEDLILGCVTQVMEQGMNIAKSAAQISGYGQQLCGITINRFCGSGLEAVNQAAASICAGFTQLSIAGGVESMSRVPMASDGGAMLTDPNVALSGYAVPQGISADLIATKYGFTRRDLDEFAYQSHLRAHNAQRKGYFVSRIALKDPNGMVLLDKDENIRPETTLEALAQLNPSFEIMGEMGGFDAVAIDKYPEIEYITHSHHAGNSSAIVDGASLALIGTKTIGEQMGIKPKARIRAAAICGTDPTMMLLGPAPAARKALAQAGMTTADIDLYEINEAFAVVPLRFMQELNISHDKVNVNGGAIAMGHPLGATGCMLLGTVLDELERRDKNTGLITLCIGGGMGIATIIERV